MAADEPRFLIVAMDGLRPDMISEDACPAVARFIAEGCLWPHARTVFPSETRVVTPTVATGAWPARHGLVANTFPMPGGGLRVNTAPVEGLLAAVAHYGDALVAAPTLGDRLAAADKRIAVVSAGTAGNAYCLNPRARGRGQPTFSVQGPDVSTPAADHAGVEERLGPTPAQALPNTARCCYATRVLLEEMLPRHDPHVAVIWYSEPDIAMHFAGIGSDTCQDALASVDSEFARLLSALDARPDAARWNVILLSDHGQVTIREKLDMAAQMRAAGFRAGPRIDADTDYAVVSSSCGNIVSRDGQIARLADWMREQPWVGLLFSRGANEVEGHVAGSFALGLVGLDHERTPHLVYTLGQDDNPNAYGFAGGAVAGTDDPPPPGFGGIHGGVHAKELACLLAARGPLFPALASAEAAVGPIDIAPTVLAAFGIAPAETVSGGPLVRPGLPQRLVFETGAGTYAARLAMLEIGTRRYLDSGRRAS
ncbi:MAG: alkaline phosphatase family protein [Alphaproteobacteria bacterium]|nr:alkaline phosphatase family protein [Alphaproteobacteria bacterium]MCY4317930.1 alkaline phosphatase family protein [Alphaproteobacteria bacterium]